MDDVYLYSEIDSLDIYDDFVLPGHTAIIQCTENGCKKRLLFQKTVPG